jgi:WD40 repeat protein
MLLFAAVLAAPPAPLSFIRDVAPILRENCFACHDAKKKAGKYDMTTFARLMAGGANGEMIVPGKPADSECYTLIVTAEQRRMPPRDKGEAVAKEKAEIVRRWIAEGAKLDSEIQPDSDITRELRKRWTPPSPPETYSVPAPVTAMAFSPDGQTLITSGQYELLIWDAAGGKLKQRLRTRAERAYGLAFLKDGTLAVAGGRPGQEGDVRIYAIDPKPSLDGVNDRSILKRIVFDMDDAVLCLALSDDGKLLAAGGTDRTVRIWDAATGRLHTTIENHSDWVLGVAFAGPVLLSAGRDKTAKAWDLKANESTTTFPEHQNIVYSVAGRADGGVAVSVGADRQVRSWKPGGEGKGMRSGGHGDEVLKVIYDNSSKTAYTAAANGEVRSWDVENKLAAGKKFEGLTDAIYSLALSPDGTRLAAGGYDGKVAIWDAKSGKMIHSFVAVPKR